MRSRAEHLLRIVAIGTLAWYLAYVLRERRRGVDEAAASAGLHAALARWSTVTAPARVHVDLAHPPDGQERDWLAALGGAGTEVGWSGTTLAPTAIEEEPRADPARSVDVGVAAPQGAMVTLSDTLGVLDSARASATGVSAHVPGSPPRVDVRVGPVVARAALHDSLALRELLVLGAATWETKFTVAALEERGWKVDAQVALSPKRTVRQGAIPEIDTARYSAVLAIDSTAVPYRDRIVRFVRSGGGLVLWSQAATAFAAIAPGLGGTLVEDDGAAPADSAPRRAVGLMPIVGLASDDVVTERRGDLVSVAARRVGLGRVIETGYTTSWQWRMAGGDDAPDRHRAWLAGLVAGVAYTGRSAIAAAPTDVAPLASLIDHLGPASIGHGGMDTPDHLAWWVLGILAVALVVEWASRRMRGVK